MLMQTSFENDMSMPKLIVFGTFILKSFGLPISFFLFVLCLLLFVKMNLKIFCHNGKITLEIIQFPLYEHSKAKQKMIGIELGSGSPAGYLVLWFVSIFSSWLRLIINKGLRQSLYIFFWQTQMFQIDLGNACKKE